MASKKNGSDLLASRIRAMAGAPRSPAINPARAVPAPAPIKPKCNTRRSERKEAFKQGLLISETGERVQIVLKNISETGARVDFFSGGTSISGHAELSIPTLGLQRKVRIAWKDQNSAGLEFVGEPALKRR